MIIYIYIFVPCILNSAQWKINTCKYLIVFKMKKLQFIFFFVVHIKNLSINNLTPSKYILLSRTLLIFSVIQTR